MHLTDTTSTPNGHQMAVVQTDLTLLQPSVAYFTKEVNPRLAKCPLKINGRLANLGLTSVVKEAAGGRKAPVTLSRPDSRPFPTLMVGRGLVKSSGCRERTGMGLGRSWEVGELGRGVPDCPRLFWTVQNDRE